MKPLHFDGRRPILLLYTFQKKNRPLLIIPLDFMEYFYYIPLGICIYVINPTTNTPRTRYFRATFTYGESSHWSANNSLAELLSSGRH